MTHEQGATMIGKYLSKDFVWCPSGKDRIKIIMNGATYYATFKDKRHWKLETKLPCVEDKT